MGVIVLLGALAAETALAISSIATRSYQYKLRSIVRIIVFAFILFLIVPRVISWSLIYYSSIAWLLLFAVIGVVVLIHHKDKRRAYNAAYVVIKGIGMTVLLFLLTLPAILFPGYQGIPASGEYQVATSIYTYIDNNRIETFSDTGDYRKLTVKLWYPGSAEGRYPLIIFSHGGISTRRSNESLYHELASNGYVVCAIDHTYHCLFTTDEHGQTIMVDIGYMQELGKEDAKSNRQQSYEYYQKWMKIRTDDFVLS